MSGNVTEDMELINAHLGNFSTADSNTSTLTTRYDSGIGTFSEYGFEEVKRNDPSYLGDEFNAVIIGITLVLGVGGVILNVGIMSFYWEKIKSLVPFLYFILSSSDFVTAVCAVGHSVIFIAILALKNSGFESILWLLILCYFLTVVTFKVSVFVSTVFAVIRTVNIASPLIKMRKKRVIASIFLWLGISLAMSVLHIWIFVRATKDEGFRAARIPKKSITPSITVTEAREFESDWKIVSETFLIGFFYQPNKGKFLRRLFQGDRFQASQAFGQDWRNEQKQDPVISECLISMGYTASPITLCATITLVATVIQVVLLLRTDTRKGTTDPEGEMRKNRKISVTIILIGANFIICSFSTLYYPFALCFQNNKTQRPNSLYYNKVYVSSYIPFFLNAVLNPLILVLRASQLREYMCSSFCNTNRFRRLQS